MALTLNIGGKSGGPLHWIVRAGLPFLMVAAVLSACNDKPQPSAARLIADTPAPESNPTATPLLTVTPEPTAPPANPTPSIVQTPEPTPTPTSTIPANTPTPTGPIAVLRDVVFKLELALSPAEKARGLGFRSSLPLDTGMLFVYDSKAQQTFWMKGVEFPIDIIWLSEKRTIVDITHEAQPQPGVPDRDLKRYQPKEPAQYVLEINAGLAVLWNFQRGDCFSFYNLPSGVLNGRKHQSPKACTGQDAGLPVEHLIW